MGCVLSGDTGQGMQVGLETRKAMPRLAGVIPSKSHVVDAR